MDWLQLSTSKATEKPSCYLRIDEPQNHPTGNSEPSENLDAMALPTKRGIEEPENMHLGAVPPRSKGAGYQANYLQPLVKR